MNYKNLHLLRSGGKIALARALAQIESMPDTEETISLLDAAYTAPTGHVVGITGPPGVGKSTLMNTCIKNWRVEERTVGVLAVDPSSRCSGGALLGDRLRLITDPEDPGLFIRSMAARDKLGGLAELTISSMILMRALYDIVLIETVGVGQSETDIANVADTILFCIQPGSGDTIQFMKAGIVEIPHIILVTKADIGKIAMLACSEVRSALSLVSNDNKNLWTVPVLLVSSITGEGINQMLVAIESHAAHIYQNAQVSVTRQAQAQLWLTEAIRERFGRIGMQIVGNQLLTVGHSPFRELQTISKEISKKLGLEK